MYVVGELRQHQHIHIALELGRIGARVTSWGVSAIDERCCAVAGRIGDRSAPANEGLGTAASVAIEIFFPRIGRCDGEGSTFGGGTNACPVTVFTAAIGSHSDIICGVGIQVCNSFRSSGSRAESRPCRVISLFVFNFPRGFLVSSHPVDGDGVLGDTCNTHVRSHTSGGRVASSAKYYIVAGSGGCSTCAAGRYAGGAVWTGVLVNVF